MVGRTRFDIAQRISTVRDADSILVLEDGQIAATGSHSDLMRDSAIYAEIYSSQLESESDLMPDLLEEDAARAQDAEKASAPRTRVGQEVAR